MKSKLSRDTAQCILDDVLDKIPRPEILNRYDSLTGAMLSRIESGKWFHEQDARDAKNGGKYPKGMSRCPLCHKVVQAITLRKGTTSCLECEVRVLPLNGRCYTDQFVDELDLELHLTADQEAARQEVRTGVFGG